MFTVGKAVGRCLGFIAVIFSAIFFTSSVEVYRAGRAENKAQWKVKDSTASTLDEFRQTSRAAVLTELWLEKSTELVASSEAEGQGVGAPHAQLQKHKRALPGYSVWSIRLNGSDKNLAARLIRDNKKNEKVVDRFPYIWSTDKDVINRRATANKNYEKALAEFAATMRFVKENLSIKVYSPDGSIVYTVAFSNSIDDYSYDRLLLESQRRTGRLSAREYQVGVVQLLDKYAKWIPPSEVTNDEQGIRSQLNTAEQQIGRLQEQVDSLKKQLAQAERTSLEKWLPVIAAVISLLIALSAHFIAWRADRRHSREAELLPLKRQEIEKNIIQKEQEIRERNGRIITPNSHEVQLYSRTVAIDDLNRVIHFKS